MALRQSLLRLLLTPLHWCLANRWRARVALVLLLAVVAGVSALIVAARERRTARDQLIAENWRRLNLALEHDKPDAAEALLVQLAELAPNDTSITARLTALRSGEADASDGSLARVLMAEHLRHNRSPEATREAAKVVAATPGHMLARALLARQALRDGHLADARAHLAAIPSPFDNADSATPGTLLFVINLQRELGDDDSELIAFVALRLVPILRSRQVDQVPLDDALQLLQCYHLACGALDRYPQLAEYWAPASRLLARLGGDPARATTIALVREAHLAVVYQLRRSGALSAKETAGLVNESESEVRAAWTAALARDERDPRPYVGLALASHRRGNADEARQWLERGLRACEQPRELYLILGRLLRTSDPLTGAAFLEQAYDRFPNDKAIRQLLAELAFAAGRPDRARVVCRAARAADSAAHWANRLEAAACLAMGRPTAALEALAPIQATLARDAAAMDLYVRAACAVGAEASAEELLAAAPVEADGHLGAARGYLAASRPADAVRCARTVAYRFPDHRPARVIYAEGLRLLAEAGDAATWPAERVRDALAAFDWLRQRDPGNRHVAQRMAWLELKGLNAPALALRSVAPLREEGAALTPEMSETLAAVLLANGDVEPALRVFDATLERAPSRAGAYIGRAATLARLGRLTDALTDLDRAATLPRTPRQTAEWQRIAKELRGER